MELSEAISNRRSIRKYKTDDIKKEIVENIIDYGRLAPSAKNRQPWYFVIVKDDLKNKIADMMIEDSQKRNITEEDKNNDTICFSANVIKIAPILILVFKEKNNEWLISDTLSIGACVENMCLRATDLGIGSLWIRDISCISSEVAKILNHNDLELNCAVVLGYQDQFPKPRPRKELKEIIEWYN